MDLRVHGAGFVAKQVEEASREWSDCEGLASRTGQAVPLGWAPLHAAIKASTNPLRAYAIAATVSGGQWCADTLAGRGGADSQECTLCGEHGTQLHRLLRCPGWKHLRAKTVSQEGLRWAEEMALHGVADVGHLRIPLAIMQGGFISRLPRES
eukprot:3777552-Amphidinium_carterae.1